MMKFIQILLILVGVQASEVNVYKGKCVRTTWSKRDVRQADFGPFWANRGKKDPKYLHNKLYAEEPHWILVRRGSERYGSDYDPYFAARGKRSYLMELLEKIRKSGNPY